MVECTSEGNRARKKSLRRQLATIANQIASLSSQLAGFPVEINKVK